MSTPTDAGNSMPLSAQACSPSLGATGHPSSFRLGPIRCSTHTIPELLADVCELLHDRTIKPRTILCVNAHICNLAWEDLELAKLLNQSRVVAADGMAVVWAARLFGAHAPERCNMTEAFRSFLHSPSFPLTNSCVIGGTEKIASLASARIEQECSHTTIVASLTGYLSEESYQRAIQLLPPIDLFLLGLGTPKSEQLAHVISRLRPEAVVWHIGGGTLLFLANQLPEAPKWLRRLGFQWVHRLIIEPRRLWKRYLIGNPLFLWRVLKQRFGLLRLAEDE